MAEQEALLNPKGAAKIFGCSPATMRKLAREGKLPHVLVGQRLYRFNAREIIEALKREKKD
jgi:excisionase family DNA binding protein